MSSRERIADSILVDVLDYLVSLVDDAAEPTVAHVRFKRLRARHSDVGLRLLWQREQYDNSLQYDVLITPPDMGTISLAYGGRQSLPWSLRGGQRTSERLLLRVNGVDMELDQAIATLDFIWDEAPLTQRLIDACLVSQALDEAPLELSTRDLQAAMDAFRRSHGLLTAEQTVEWMVRHCLSHKSLEELVAREAAVANLRKVVTQNEVEAFFDSHRAELASAQIAWLLFADMTNAQGARDMVRAGHDFYQVAEASLPHELVQRPTGLFTTIRRAQLPIEISDPLFDAPPGTTLGPYGLDDAYAVIKVIAVHAAVLDTQTVELIEERLFRVWLAERQRSARIEWFWGNRGRIPAGVDAPDEHARLDDLRD